MCSKLLLSFSSNANLFQIHLLASSRPNTSIPPYPKSTLANLSPFLYSPWTIATTLKYSSSDLYVSIHGWGTQEECLTPKSFLRHYFE